MRGAIFAVSAAMLLMAATISVGHAATPFSAVTGEKPPDWSGAWITGWKVTGIMRLQPQELPVFRDPEKRRIYQERQAPHVSGADTNSHRAQELGFVPRTECGDPTREPTPWFFSGKTGITANAMLEFLFTPGRVTVLSNANQVRRIYLTPQKFPDNYPTPMGFSRDHWEGLTLVVETDHLSPETQILGEAGGRVGAAGEGFKVVERIYLKDQNT